MPFIGSTMGSGRRGECALRETGDRQRDARARNQNCDPRAARRWAAIETTVQHGADSPFEAWSAAHARHLGALLRRAPWSALPAEHLVKRGGRCASAW